MIDVSDLIVDPDFAFNFTVIRTTGKWIKGRFVLSQTPQRLRYYGSVQPATPKEIEQLPTGDQPKGVMKFFCKHPKQIFLTRDLSNVRGESDGAASDEIFFKGSIYQVVHVTPWDHNGWQRAFAVLKGGAVWNPPS
jgi:hypothetical protein